MSSVDEVINFLIIEDNEGDFVLISESIEENFPYANIDWAPTYEEALNHKFDDYDVILLDLSLDNISGEPLIKDMRNRAPKVPIIVLTGYTNKAFALKSIGLGMSDYLIKDELHPEILYRSVIYSIERKKIFNKLEESEVRYKELFQFNPLPMWVLDQKTNNILSVNEAAIRSYGFSYEEFLEKSFFDIQIEKVESTSPSREKEPNYCEKISGLHLHKKKKGDTITVETSVNNININGEDVKLVLSIDVTQKYIHLRTIEKQYKQLKEISWVQSHIVRAPLARLMGLVNLFKMTKVELPQEEKEMLKHIEVSAEELDGVIRDINEKASKVKGSGF
ncbi:response regulator [Cyclobacterium marinum]|uniref:response regulator n=1 Tax=Cyclobacterium marinum TaxID=104 RepID=UPI0011EC4A31|nr:response regulator [Cyclobacterium marinum]MBI0398818.1 response regulator [Cyclobacterium marinum]